MYKSGSAIRFDRIWNVSTDGYTGKHVELAIKRDVNAVDWVYINCYQCGGRTSYPTEITFENANQFCKYIDLKLCVHGASALLKCMSNLLEDRAKIFISEFDNTTCRKFLVYVHKICDDKSDYIITEKTGGFFVQHLSFTPSEFQKLQNMLPEVLSYAGKSPEPMEY